VAEKRAAAAMKVERNFIVSLEGAVRCRTVVGWCVCRRGAVGFGDDVMI